LITRAAAATEIRRRGSFLPSLLITPMIMKSEAGWQIALRASEEEAAQLRRVIARQESQIDELHREIDRLNFELSDKAEHVAQLEQRLAGRQFGFSQGLSHSD
jgi:septal ring factor EnvC (AmiA/AmiB activator)